jgi:CTP synthase
MDKSSSKKVSPVKQSSANYIFVTGGVMSGVGKGVTTASIALLIKSHGYKVDILKCENYLNVDSGTINPIEHGDPFLTEDGTEADMDLGTYERFLDQDMGSKNYVTMGQIYKTVIDRERSFGYKGEDVEPIPHVTDEIIERIEALSKDNDIVMIEIGGTVGDYQNALYFEACRQMRYLHPDNVMNIHVTYVPLPPTIGEPKTMPTQTSIRILMGMGIQPDVLVLRSSVDFDERRKYLLGMKCSVRHVVTAPDLSSTAELPIKFSEQELDKLILEKFKFKNTKKDISKWIELVNNINENKNLKKEAEIEIAIVGKYFATGNYDLIDSYHALFEAIKHSAVPNNVKIKYRLINSDKSEKDIPENLIGVDGIIVPIGWGQRGSEGMIKAIQYARETKTPYLGLCFGMQLATVEYARNVLGWKDANSEELNPDTTHPIIHAIPEDERYQRIKAKGVTMRLGAFDCVIKNGSHVYEIYNKYNDWKDKKKNLISERHRHRYEFNNEYREALEKAGMVFSGTSPDNFFVEMIELPKTEHPFFVATQAHPEYKSRPTSPHPLFMEFIKASKGVIYLYDEK